MIINEYISYIVLIKRGKIQPVGENRKKWYGGRLHLIHYAPPLINWQPGDWALDCDFMGNDFANIQVRGEDCGQTCWATTGCLILSGPTSMVVPAG